MHLSRYLKVFPAQDQHDHFMLYSTIRGSLARVSGATLRAIQQGLEPGPQGETLLRLGLLVHDPNAEKEQMRSMLVRANARSRSFSSVVVLNLDCNLNCGYCYEGNFRGEHYMSEATAQLLVATLLRDRISQGMDLVLSFYGGEPLLSQELIRMISEPLLEAAARYHTSYRFNLVTNGTLLSRSVAEKLLPLGLQGAKLTLDGPREVHNGQRPFASGAGSFDTILDNIAAIWDIVPIHLGGNFRQDNYRSFPQLLDQLIAAGITPEKIPHVQFTPVTPKAGCAEYGSGCSSSSEPWLIEAFLLLREEILARGFATSKPSVSACIVEFQNNLVVNHEGWLYKCPAFMGNEDLRVGSLAAGTSDYDTSHAVGNWQTDACLDCPYLPLCFGGCRFLSLARGKTMAELDCRRDFLDATLERFLLQNIAYPTHGKKP